mgnify:CR=1 FL=1
MCTTGTDTIYIHVVSLIPAGLRGQRVLNGVCHVSSVIQSSSFFDGCLVDRTPGHTRRHAREGHPLLDRHLSTAGPPVRYIKGTIGYLSISEPVHSRLVRDSSTFFTTIISLLDVGTHFSQDRDDTQSV